MLRFDCGLTEGSSLGKDNGPILELLCNSRFMRGCLVRIRPFCLLLVCVDSSPCLSLFGAPLATTVVCDDMATVPDMLPLDSPPISASSLFLENSK